MLAHKQIKPHVGQWRHVKTADRFYFWCYSNKFSLNMNKSYNYERKKMLQLKAH